MYLYANEFLGSRISYGEVTQASVELRVGARALYACIQGDFALSASTCVLSRVTVDVYLQSGDTIKLSMAEELIFCERNANIISFQPDDIWCRSRYYLTGSLEKSPSTSR